MLQTGGVVRLAGQGIDGGVIGAQSMIGQLYRGDSFVVGVCGEKDCAPSNLGVATIGCLSRVGGGGDDVADQAHAVAFAHSNSTRFGCKLDEASEGATYSTKMPLSGLRPPRPGHPPSPTRRRFGTAARGEV